MKLIDKDTQIRNIKNWWHKDGHLNDNQRNYMIELFNSIKAKNVLEIGFATGRSASVIEACLKPELFISIDKDLDYLDAREFAKAMVGHFPSFRITEADTIELFQTKFLEENFPEGIDFSFIDGGHTYEAAYNDMSHVFKHLNIGGYMLIDDYMSGKPDGAVLKGVTKAVDDFCSEVHMLPAVWNVKGKGFALIQKLEEDGNKKG